MLLSRGKEGFAARDNVPKYNLGTRKKKDQFSLQ